MSLFGSYSIVRHGKKATLTPQEEHFNKLMDEGNVFEKQKEYLSALKSYITAKHLKLSKRNEQKLIKKIDFIQDKCWDKKLDEKEEAFQQIGTSRWYLNIVTDHYHIKQDKKYDDNDEDEDCKNDGHKAIDYILPAQIYDKLYQYQRECLVWLWTVFQSNNGGILGDDMGLGKTVQICAYLNGAFFSDLIRCVILIVPVSMISNWTKELKKWCKGANVAKYYSAISVEEREDNLAFIAKKGGVLITTYGMVQRNAKLLIIGKKKWDYMILDEGHIIKNHLIATSKAVRQIPVKKSNKIILTGTFLQNELSELWSLFDFISDGDLFGSYDFFNKGFVSKINAGRLKNASTEEKQLSVKLLNLIKKIIAPYLLSRSKEEIRCNFECEKRDLVVWIKLSDIQMKIYRSFLESESVKQILNSSKSPLSALNVMKKICDHPFLLSDKIIDCHSELTDKSIENTLLTSSKMYVLLELLVELINNKHRILVFSQSRIILTMIQRILQENKIKYLSMNGETKIDERQHLVDKFNTNIKICVFLLSTKVGGLGLNLVGSDRVIIYDPSWNPAIDAQAVDRSYRIGQVKDVMVYRFVTCGTIEERIYQRQISKVGLLKSVINDSNQERYFTKNELNKEVLKLKDPHISQTQIQFKQLHQDRIGTNPKFDRETNYVEQIQNVFGISHHDLLFKAS